MTQPVTATPTPVFDDDGIQLYAGDCRDLAPLVCPQPAVIVTDPPYGTGEGGYLTGSLESVTVRHRILGDDDTGTRDDLLSLYPHTPAVVFGSPLRPPPARALQALVYRKAPGSGAIAARAGWRRDIELVYLCGSNDDWPQGPPARSAVIETRARSQGNPWGVAARYGHPHAKPLDVLAEVIATCPPGLILDPFAGSATTLLAARMVGRPAIGIELDPAHIATARRNLAQAVIDFGDTP